MAEDFYPFVENGQGDTSTPLIPRYPARIAVYDDASAAPRVVVIEPKDVRAYLEEITLQVTQLAQAQGGTIPFMVIREIVENLIHAYFIQPTVSILNHGNTIRFSDQGPGIREKALALQYGTTSATEEMRRYIRGVGSGLPYVQQYMYDKGGSLRIEDNLSGGTVVTISAGGSFDAGSMTGAPMAASPQQPIMHHESQVQAYPYGWYQGQPVQQAGQTQPWSPYQQGYPYQQGMPQPWQGQQWGIPQSMPSGGAVPTYGMPAYGAPQAYAQVSEPPQQSAAPARPEFSWINLTERGVLALDFLRTHDAVGPSDLARAHGGSQPTWTRELKALEDQGLILKDGQKRRLTAMGRAYLDHT